jgi:hypothetical protein
VSQRLAMRREAHPLRQVCVGGQERPYVCVDTIGTMGRDAPLLLLHSTTDSEGPAISAQLGLATHP